MSDVVSDGDMADMSRCATAACLVATELALRHPNKPQTVRLAVPGGGGEFYITLVYHEVAQEDCVEGIPPEFSHA